MDSRCKLVLFFLCDFIIWSQNLEVFFQSVIQSWGWDRLCAVFGEDATALDWLCVFGCHVESGGSIKTWNGAQVQACYQAWNAAGFAGKVAAFRVACANYWCKFAVPWSTWRAETCQDNPNLVTQFLAGYTDGNPDAKDCRLTLWAIFLVNRLTGASVKRMKRFHPY